MCPSQKSSTFDLTRVCLCCVWCSLLKAPVRCPSTSLVQRAKAEAALRCNMPQGGFPTAESSEVDRPDTTSRHPARAQTIRSCPSKNAFEDQVGHSRTMAPCPGHEAGSTLLGGGEPVTACNFNAQLLSKCYPPKHATAHNACVIMLGTMQMWGQFAAQALAYRRT